MVNPQMGFEEFFEGQTYGPRNEFEPRQYQVHCLNDYAKFINQEPLFIEGKRIAYIINGGTGCGKTKLVALLASHVFNIKEAEQIIVVVPNRSIRKKTREDFRDFFGLNLVVFNQRKHRDGIPRMQDGYILTYAALLSDPTLHRRLCLGVKTLVFFDEIHHLGDHPDCTWGPKSMEAFGGAAHIIGGTGTPYRLDNHPIPFVEYEPTPRHGILRFKANFTYTLGQAVADGHCRKPMFAFHYGNVKIRDASGVESVIGFDNKSVSDEMKSLRLRGAVAFGSSLRKDFLRQTLDRCRLEKRKVIIFLGGDTCGETTPTDDATEFLPSELLDLGYGCEQFEIVTGDDPTSQKKIDDFAHHPSKWILVSINMVSEGTDIPPLSAAIFLTSITAKQTTIQRIGRALRLREQDPHEDALIFMFADPSLMEIAKEIEEEVKQEITLKKRRELEGGNGGGSPHKRSEAIGVGDAPLKVVIFNNSEFPAEAVEKALQQVKDKGLPATYQNAVLTLLMKD
jgi:superfamily II DNA or RNA helicase